MTIQIFLFGHFKLIAHDSNVENFSSSRAEHLIAYLALHPGIPVKRQFLAFLLWPDSNEAQALANLRKIIFTLRHDLPDINALLSIGYDSIAIAASLHLDVHTFNSLIASADKALHNGEVSSALQALAQAVQIYQGDLLPECYDEWVIIEREILAQKYLQALTRLAELYDHQADLPNAVLTLKLLLARDPLQELAYQRLMTLYAKLQDRMAALQTYHTCATILQRELGISPSSKTQALYNELLNLSDGSDQPEKDSFQQPMVGRTQEIEALKQAWREVNKAGRIKLVLIGGESGIGKTHLAETMVNVMRRQGIHTYSARCYPAERSLSFSPLIEWMREKKINPIDPKVRHEISRIMPEILRNEEYAPPPLHEKKRRQFLFEAILTLLNQPVKAQLFFLDDIQYCDHDTLEWLHYFIRRDIQTHTLIIATCRYDEISQEHPLLPVLYSLRRIGDCLEEIVLQPFNRDETISLATQLSPHPLPELFLHELYQSSEGNPLFITELMRAYLDNEAEATDLVSRMPLKVKMLIDARLNRLSPLGRKLAGTAAVIGRGFELSLLQTVSDLDENSFLDGLDELWGHDILHQEDGNRYAFNHNLIRETAYQSMNPARRQSLHRKVACALEGPPPHLPGPLDVNVAGHYEAGNRKNLARHAFIRAALYAQSIFSINEAIRLIRKGSGLNLDEAGKLINRQEEQQIQKLLGELLLIDGQHEEARQAFLAALQVTDEKDELTRSRLLERSGAILPIQYRYDEVDTELKKAEGLISRGLHQLDKACIQLWIQIQLDRMWGNFVINRPDAMSLLAEQLRQPLDIYGTPLQHGQFYQNLVVMELRRSRYVLWESDARSYALSAAAIFQQHNYQNDLAFALFEAGFCAMWSGWRGDHVQAENDMAQALQIAERVGDKLVRARCLCYLLTLYRKRHQQDQFKQILQAAESAAWEMRHMGEFTGLINANLAWYAYSNADFDACAKYFQSVLRILKGFQIQQLFFPLYWVGFFPGAALALYQGDLPAAAGYIQRILGPAQQLLHPDVTTSLEEACAAWKSHDESRFSQWLQGAIDLAQEWGYL